MLECTIIEVTLTADGFRVLLRSKHRRTLRTVILDPAAMPSGHELLCAGAEVRLHFREDGVVRKIDEAPPVRLGLFRW